MDKTQLGNPMIRSILGLCARDCSHTIMQEQLEQVMETFLKQGGSWKDLIYSAEQQGMSPLLYKHLNSLTLPLPRKGILLLHSLVLRTRRANLLRNQVTGEILLQFRTKDIKVLAVKGIALCNTLYTSPELRPMRDVDLLVAKKDLQKAQLLLIKKGFHETPDNCIPDDYYHLPPLTKIINEMPVTIELHHNLLPFHPQYPRWPLEKSYNSSCPVMIGGVPARTLSLEDTLYYVYLHGFQAPLTYEPFRLIHVADMVSLVEKYFNKINWQHMNRQTPHLLPAISRFHFVTPWHRDVKPVFSPYETGKPRHTGIPYNGWPRKKLLRTKRTELPQLFIDTVWPSQWWTQLYYGYVKGPAYLRCRLFEHPRALWRWIKAYGLQRFKNNPTTL